MTYLDRDLADILDNAIQTNNFDSALVALKGFHPIDLADIIEQYEPISGWRLLRRLPNRADVFTHIETERQVQLAKKLPRGALAKLVSEMPADKRTDLFKRFDQNQRNALLPTLAQAERENIRILSAYEEGTAGALMTSEYATLEKAMTVSDALASLRNEAPDAETIYQAYVIDNSRRLLGVVSLRDLMLADIDTPIQALMVGDVVSGEVSDRQEYIVKKIDRYDLLALPIIDEDGVLVGIVTIDDAMDVVSAEATEDIHKSAGVSTVGGRLKDASIGLLYRKRIFWLVLLVFGNLFSGAGIAHFEDTIAANIVLVFFLPLLVDSGGNAGSQSATLMVRALATSEVVMRDWLFLLGREAIVALALGGTMAVAVSLLGFIRGDATVALVLALSMVTIVMIGCLIGMSLPFLLSRYNLDPASASAPLITSVCDAVGVVIYLYIATQLLGSISLS